MVVGEPPATSLSGVGKLNLENSHIDTNHRKNQSQWRTAANGGEGAKNSIMSALWHVLLHCCKPETSKLRRSDTRWTGTADVWDGRVWSGGGVLFVLN